MLKIIRSIKDERYRNAGLTAAFNIVTQVVVLLTGLISVPLILNYVGVEKFGIWMTLTTGLSFIAFSDFGIGIGTQDKMAKFYGLQDYKAVRNSFYTSFLFVNFIVVFLISISIFSYIFFDVNRLVFYKNINTTADEVRSLFFVVVLIFVLGIIGGIVVRAYNALQQGFFISAIQLFSRLVSLFLLYLTVHLEGSFTLLVFIVGGLPYLFIMAIGLPVLLIKFEWLRFSSLSKVFDFLVLKEVLKIGVWGFGASVSIYFVNNIITLILSVNFTLKEVAQFAVLQKLISIPIMFLSLATIPLWPAITEAKARRDFYWISGLIGKINAISFFFMLIFSFVYYVAMDDVIEIWLKNSDLVPSNLLLASVIFFMVVSFWNSNLTLILNGLSMYKSQAVMGLILGVCFAFFAYKIPSYYGVEWVVLCIATGYFLRCLYMFFEIKIITKSLFGTS